MTSGDFGLELAVNMKAVRGNADEDLTFSG
jgi:hypothetical protein